MKKNLFCLAATALLATGCTGGNSYKVSEKKFNAEVADYGVVLNNNARFEGTAVMGLTNTLTVEVDSEGDAAKFKVHQAVEGEGEMVSYQQVDKNEDNTYNITWIRKGFGETSYTKLNYDNLSWDDAKSYIMECVYIPSAPFKNYEFDSKENIYECDSYTTSMKDEGFSLAIVYTNIKIQFKDNRLFSIEFSLQSGEMQGSVQMEKTQTGGVAVTLPTIS